jgi:hypothetical protein
MNKVGKSSVSSPENPRRVGRQAGTPNRLTQEVKTVIEQVAQGLGGAQGMLTWAQAHPVNERLFWSNIYPKLLPKSLKAEHSGPNGQPLSHGVLVVPATLSVEDWERVAQSPAASSFQASRDD